jgi:hypothetical protein
MTPDPAPPPPAIVSQCDMTHSFKFVMGPDARITGPIVIYPPSGARYAKLLDVPAGKTFNGPLESCVSE